MNVFFIYKQIADNTGNIQEIEIIECDKTEQAAQSFSKLYNLQIPVDLRNKISYHYAMGKVI